MSYRDIKASIVWTSQERVDFILTKDRAMQQLSACWVPRFLIFDQKHTGRTISRANENHLEADPANFLQMFVTIDVKWIHHFKPKAKQKSEQ